MHVAGMSGAVRERLGEEATNGLVDWMQSRQDVWSDDVLSTASERFERRLTESLSGLRVEMHEGFGGLRQEIAESLAAVRQELTDVGVEILKWSFLFWVGQLAAMAGLLAFMLRGTGA